MVSWISTLGNLLPLPIPVIKFSESIYEESKLEEATAFLRQNRVTTWKRTFSFWEIFFKIMLRKNILKSLFWLANDVTLYTKEINKNVLRTVESLRKSQQRVFNISLKVVFQDLNEAMRWIISDLDLLSS